MNYVLNMYKKLWSLLNKTIINMKIFNSKSNKYDLAVIDLKISKENEASSLSKLANSYLTTSIVLLENSIDDNIYLKDDLIMPIVFLVNQGIELHIKSIRLSLNVILGVKKRRIRSSDLHGLWISTKNKMIQCTNDINKDEFNSWCKPIENYIDEWIKITYGDNSNLDYPTFNFGNNRNYIHNYCNVLVDLKKYLILVRDINDSFHRISQFYLDSRAKNC